MPLVQGVVGAPSSSSSPDGQSVTQLFGKQNDAMVSELHGKYFTQNYRGKLWYANIFTASAIPIFATNATPNFFIWNPAGNTTNVVLARIAVGFSAGTGVAGAIGYSYISNISGLVGTAAPVSAATTTTILSGVVGNAYAGQVVAGSAATISGTAPSALKQHSYSNMSQGAPITTTASFWTLADDIDGRLILPPGCFFCLTASTAVAETVVISAAAYEVPL